mmetsp:Transcript_33519/g.57466  ORF Transcript_33519/g.57466 Transcript_33519/m.57466 type:complete len:225 (-) Transcript_33519:168-842(-)
MWPMKRRGLPSGKLGKFRSLRAYDRASTGSDRDRCTYARSRSAACSTALSSAATTRSMPLTAASPPSAAAAAPSALAALSPCLALEAGALKVGFSSFRPSFDASAAAVHKNTALWRHLEAWCRLHWPFSASGPPPATPPPSPPDMPAPAPLSAASSSWFEHGRRRRRCAPVPTLAVTIPFAVPPPPPARPFIPAPSPLPLASLCWREWYCMQHSAIRSHSCGRL